MIKRLFIIILFIFICSSSFAQFNLRDTPIVEAVKKASPSVVNISSEKIVKTSPFLFFETHPFEDFFKDFFDLFPEFESREKSLGSGVIIDKNGYILTNEHVIASSTKIKITLIDKREFEAKLVGADPKFDIAVLKINSKNKLPVCKLGTSKDLMIGETVIAIGNPFGLSNTVTVGVISALHRSIKVDNKIYDDFIQTDASINPGNSGGPLLNIKGEVIGINTAIYRGAIGIGFAIPIDRAIAIYKDIINFGEVQYPWIGIEIQPLTSKLKKYFKVEKGVIVTYVYKNSPAKKAKIEEGDIILEINDEKITSAEDYNFKISSFLKNTKQKFKILRDGKILNIFITPEVPPESLYQEVSWRRLGVKVKKITKGDISLYRLYTKEGVLIKKVRRGSYLWNIGVRVGDVIKEINNRKIKDLKTYKKLVFSIKKYSGVLINIQRGEFSYNLRLYLY